MVHIEQLIWPPTPAFPSVKFANLNETELWIFKDRLYNNLCTVKEEPTGSGYLWYTVFEDNANTCFGVYSNGNPASEWCYVREVRKIKCGHET